MAAVLGVPVSAASYLFLVAADKLQKWLYTMLPGSPSPGNCRASRSLR